MKPVYTPAVRYILVHEGRNGLRLFKFATRRDIKIVAGVTVYEDFNGDHDDLMRFMEIPVEPGDYIMVLPDPKVSEGEW